MHIRLFVVLFLLATFFSRSASAQPEGLGSNDERSNEEGPTRQDPPRAWALGTGIAALVVPFGVGATLLSRPGRLGEPQAAVLVTTAGLTLAPILSHAIVGEWGRAAAFGVLPLLTSASIVAITEARPDVLTEGTKFTRVTWGTLLAVALFSSAIGVIDTYFSTDRAASSSIALSPVVGPTQAGLALEGPL